MQSIRRTLGRILLLLGLPDAEVNVLFTGVRAMRTLNRRYRGKDRPTDVLSFSFREGAFPQVQPDLLGDIVIAVPVAERQAREQGHALGREIERLLVHGVLHLAGYDHEKNAAAALRMRRKELQLLGKLGTHPPR